MCSEQVVSAEAEANMKNPSKAALLQPTRRLLLVFYAAKIPFSLAGLLSGLLGGVLAAWTRTERVDSECRLETCELEADSPNMSRVL